MSTTVNQDAVWDPMQAEWALHGQFDSHNKDHCKSINGHSQLHKMWQMPAQMPWHGTPAMGIECSVPLMAPHLMRMDALRDIHGQAMTKNPCWSVSLTKWKSTNWGKFPSKIAWCASARLHELNSNELACANAGYAQHTRMQIKHYKINDKLCTKIHDQTIFNLQWLM